MADTMPSILIVEDDRVVAKDVQQTLAGLGYDAYAVVSSGEKAVAEASTRCPDLVIMDVRLNGPLDGIATADILRVRFGVPAVYLTAFADDATIERAKKTDPYGYLVKPVTTLDLKRVVELALHRRKIERLRERQQPSARAPRSVAASSDVRPRPQNREPSEPAIRRSTVLLADDHIVVREGLAKLLTDKDFEVTGAVGDGPLLIEMAKRLRPDVIVTDISMPKLSGLEVLARLKAEGVTSKIIVLTMHDDADMATRAMRAGASGFLLKHSAGDELVHAIQEVLHDRVYLTPTLTRDVMERLAAPSAPAEPTLTERQRDVLRLILDGRRMKEIAAVLNLSTRTVESHKYEMMRVLGVSSTPELVKYAIERRLIVV